MEQYRKALERSIIEIPAGKLEQGEDPAFVHRRELEEETGYGAGELSIFSLSQHLQDLQMKLFIFMWQKIYIK